MDRFEAIHRLDGGEVFDNVTQRTLDILPSFPGALAEAARLNKLVRAAGHRATQRALTNRALGLS